MDQELRNALNAQIKHELDSAYLYLAMSAHFEAENLPGFAKWMRLQAREEQAHAMRFFDYLNDRGERIVLDAVDRPPAEFDSPLAIFEAAQEHEKKVTGLIHSLYDLASQKKDYATQVMLQWFVEEQVEEEKSAGEIVLQLRMVGTNPAALFMLDRQMGSRSEAEH